MAKKLTSSESKSLQSSSAVADDGEIGSRAALATAIIFFLSESVPFFAGA
jgi:hypothetical protein